MVSGGLIRFVEAGIDVICEDNSNIKFLFVASRVFEPLNLSDCS